MAYPRGSEWSIWDLHVHTPASIVQHYGDESEDTWQRFLSELEQLPSEIHVLGINDYWFLDGYKRVREARDSGRLANIREIFPVVEFRLSMFGGTESSLKRQNLHVIFDPTLDITTIQSQFLNALEAKFTLLPERRASWSGSVTRESLVDLGRAIKTTAPPDKLADYGSDLMEGFNSLVIEHRAVYEALDRHYFAGRHLVGLGKAEWSAVRWNDQSVAAKRDLVGRVDFLFTAFQAPGAWPDSVAKMKSDKVLHKIFDCSDAHHWTNASQSERIGNCRNWVNAAPTFSGLRHAVAEFDHRVYVGLEPGHLSNISRNPDRYINSISVRPVTNHHSPVFDYAIDLNSQFIAVVGNKGKGKSALLDCLGLAGGSSRTSEFAFLNTKRFLNSRNPDAKNYAATITWRDGSQKTARLTSVAEPASGKVRVEYLPQAFVERVCTADQHSEAARDFESELRKVLFSHISDEDRAGARDFDSLLEKRTATSEVKIRELRQELGRLVWDYLDLIEFSRKNPAHLLEAKIKEQQRAYEEALRATESARSTLEALDAKSEAAGAVA